MLTHRSALVTYLVIAAFSFGLFGPRSESHAGGADLAGGVNSYLTTLAQDHYFSGGVLASQAGAVILNTGYGAADWSTGTPFTAQTVFPIGVFDLAAASILQLEDAGRLRDSTPICSYIPGCPSAWQAITVQEVLNFTSGLHDYFNAPTQGSVETRAFSLTSLITYLKGEPIDSAAGINCCSVNADLPVEEYLIQRVSGEAFGTYLRQHFLVPLHLAHTGYYLHQAPRLAHVRGYVGWRQPAPDLQGYDFSSIGGVLFTNLVDLDRLETALYGGRMLSAASTTRLTTFAYASEASPPQYAITFQGTTAGNGTLLSFYSHPVIQFSWSLPSIGLQAGYVYLPDRNLLLIAVDNDPNAFPADGLSQILARIYSSTLPPKAPGSIGLQTLRPQSCSLASTLTAPQTYIPSTVTFKNQSSQAVSIYALDQTANRQLYTTLAPGDSSVQQTAQATPFVVATAGGTCLEVVIARGALAQVLIPAR